MYIFDVISVELGFVILKVLEDTLNLELSFYWYRNGLWKSNYVNCFNFGGKVILDLPSDCRKNGICYYYLHIHFANIIKQSEI